MAKDKFHDIVKTALKKDGWTITHDPLHLESLGFSVLIDLGAERLISASKGQEKIAVEVKGFLGESEVSQFHTALGQYLNYRDVLATEQLDYKLFLAIPADAYETTFALPFIQNSIQRYHLSLVVYNPVTEVIVTWHK